jgi:hypothetical protein
MAHRHLMVFVGLASFLSLGANYRTQNFVVTAPNAQIAQQVGQYAEHYRKEKAMQWLGKEMQPWPEPCPLRVKVTAGGSGGATSFAFDRGQVLGQNMNIEGTLERLLASVLPHEVTHTVFAYHFRQPVPRWADEGGSVLSEDDLERQRHDKLVRNILNNRRAMPLRRLFALKEYPPDVMVLYAQGFSVTNFLVSKSSKPAFLNFVNDGMQKGWDQAVQAHYGYQNVEALEQAWLQHLRDTKSRPPADIARGPAPATTSGTPTEQIVSRQTVPPAQPFEDPRGNVYRGAAPRPDDMQPYRPAGFSPAATIGPPVVKLGPPEMTQPYPMQQEMIIPMPGYPR